MGEISSNIWNRVLKIMKLKVSESEFNSWLINVKPISLDDDCFVVEVDNSFIREKIEENYRDNIVEILNDFLLLDTYKDLKINIKRNLMEDKEEEKIEFEEKINQKVEKDNSIYKNHFSDTFLRNDFGNLNPKYIFNAFVVGKSNELVYAASKAISNGANKGYNPFFIYGGVGLGKTHLMQAIGNEISKKDSGKKVYYCSSEKFTNDLINSLKNDKMMEFREKYRKLDVLLIDDIQFIAGKDSTQEEYFHTFNELHQAGKQIIMTSDRPPKEINKIEKRLMSRFEWGLIADIQQPDYETRVAILKKKAEIENINIGENILRLIAERINSNIRELEGALNKIVATGSLLKREITKDLVEEVFYDVNKRQMKVITKDKIVKEVCEFYNITYEEIMSKSRKKEISNARQVSMFLIREILKESLTAIGDYFGGKDHTTVMHSFNRVSDESKINKYFDKDIKGIKEKIMS